MQEGAAGSNNNNDVPVSPDSEPARFNTSRNITKCHNKLLIFYSGIVQRCFFFVQTVHFNMAYQDLKRSII